MSPTRARRMVSRWLLLAMGLGVLLQVYGIGRPARPRVERAAAPAEPTVVPPVAPSDPPLRIPAAVAQAPDPPAPRPDPPAQPKAPAPDPPAPPAPAADPPAPKPAVAHSLSYPVALARGLVSARVESRGPEHLVLWLASRARHPLVLGLPRGLVFRSRDASVADVTTINAPHIRLAPGQARYRTVAVFGLDPRRRPPARGDRFDAAASRPASLRALFGQVLRRPASAPARRLGLWIAAVDLPLTADPPQSITHAGTRHVFDQAVRESISEWFLAAGLTPRLYRAFGGATTPIPDDWIERALRARAIPVKLRALARLAGDDRLIRRHAPALVQLTQDRSPAVVALARRRLGSPVDLALVERVLSSPTAEEREVGAALVQGIDAPRRLQLLIRRSQRGSTAARLQAIEVLGKTGGDAARAALRTLIAEDLGVVGEAAMTALGLIGDPRDHALIAHIAKNHIEGRHRRQLAADALDAIARKTVPATPRRRWTLSGRCLAAAGSPDGRRLAYADGARLYRRSLGGAARAVDPEREAPVTSLALADDGHLAIGDADGVVSVRDPDDRLRAALGLRPGPVRSVAATAAGLVIVDRAGLRLWDWRAGRVRWFRPGADLCAAVGSRRVLVGGPAGLALLELASGRPLPGPVARARVTAVALDAAGRAAWAVGARVTHGRLGGAWRSIRRPPGVPIGALAFSPEGRWLLVGEGPTVIACDLPEGTVAWRLHSHTQRLRSLLAGPDGSLVSASGDRICRWVARGR